jgi:amidohydrolase
MTDHRAPFGDFMASFLSRHEEWLIRIRRDLHAHPELGGSEYRTTGLICRELEAHGLTPRILPGGTGVLCDIGAGPADSVAPMVALRADIDALAIADVKTVSYRSQVPGVTHACGHDVHTAIGIGCGWALQAYSELRPLDGPVRLIFQPAEETFPGGAVDVIAAGGLEGVSAILAVHCDPTLDVGVVGIREGAITSTADVVTVRLLGDGGHTGRPQLTADLVYISGRIVTEVPSGLSRRSDVRDGVSLVFGSIHAGDAPNAIPSRAEMRGTLRSLTRRGWETAPAIIRQLAAGVAEPLGARCEVEIERGAPPVVNHPLGVEIFTAGAIAALGESGVVGTAQSSGGEDFSWYLDHVPGAFGRLGVGRPEVGGGRMDLHRADFDVDERAIGVGVSVLSHAAMPAHHRLGHPG